MPSGATPEEIVGLAFEAISDRDGERLLPLLAPGVTIRTMRGTHEGHEAALAWIGKGYEHLDKRFRIDDLEPVTGAGRMLGHGRVEYVWRESGEVGDSTPIFVVVELLGGLLHRLELYETLDEARDALGD
jgi:hypothetical protein